MSSTTERKADILRKVRGLLDKAQSTTFEGERDALLAKADELMTAYTIESWELEFAKPAGTREKPVMQEYKYGSSGDHEVDGNLSAMFWNLARFARVKIGWFGWSQSKIVGYQADIDYLDQIFTSLRLHLAMNLVPHADPALSYQESLALLKEAGYKWAKVYQELVKVYPQRFVNTVAHIKEPGQCPERQEAYDPAVARWQRARHEYDHALVVKDGDTEYHFKEEMPRPIGVRFTKEYTEFCRDTGRERIYSDPTVWRRNFSAGYTERINSRIREMERGRSSATTGKELVLASREDDLMEALYELFPEKRPHPQGCDCDACHYCRKEGCKRPRCVDARRPVRSRGAVLRELRVDHAARDRGRQTAETANLMGSRGNVGQQKQLPQ